MTYQRKAKPCPFGLIPEEDVCGKHPHCIAHKEPVSTCPERGKENPREPLAELEQLRRRVAVLEKMIAVLKKYDGAISCPYHIGLIKAVCRDYATCSECWTAALTQAEGGE